MISKIKKILATNEKNKEVLTNSFLSLLIKGMGFIVSFVSMPLYIKYFDNQSVLGIWFTIISVLSWILTFDLGLGNGLRNLLVEPLIKKDYKKAKEYISSTYFIVTLLTFVLCFVGVFAFQFINWNNILNVEPNVISNDTFKICITIVYIGILISFILKIINSILYAMQKTAVNNVLALLTSIIPLIYLLLASDSGIQVNFIKLSIVNMVANCLPLLVATIFIFATKLRKCIPNIKCASKKMGLSILKYGGTFFAIQIFFMLITSTNEIIISSFFGSEFVVEYQIYFRVFTALGTLFTLALSPIWSAVTKAISEEDYLWVKRINKLLYKILILSCALQLIIVPFLQPFVNIWLGSKTININYFYAIVFALFGGVFIWNIIATTIANGTGKLKTQLYGYSIGAIIKIVIIVLINEFYSNWIITVIANIIVLLAFCIIQTVNINKYVNEKCK